MQPPSVNADNAIEPVDHSPTTWQRFVNATEPATHGWDTHPTTPSFAPRTDQW